MVEKVFAAALLAQPGLWCAGPNAAAAPERSIEDLNLVGTPVTLPRFSDTLLGTDSAFRRALFRRGLLLRVMVLPRVSMNLLEAPVAPARQVYVGQRPTWISGLNPVLTADLRQLGLRDTQLYIGGGWRWTNWNPAGPRTVSLSSLYLYKKWAEQRLEVKAGYMGNDLEFIGMQVGGSLATGAQGVYAVLPYQAGMAYFPLPAPTLNVRVKGPGSTYVKVGAQRSLDAAGGVATQARNQTGLRFLPKGNRLLLIQEAGYLRASSETSPYAWLRAGYLHNDTLYTNKESGRKEAGNYCAFALLDYQVRRPENGPPAHGLYAGASVMAAPARFNVYDKYYEARVYQKAPLKLRPDDMLSFIAAYRGHSRIHTAGLAAQGKTVWHGSPSVTASYSIHLSPGHYLSVGLGWVRGAAVTPRVADTMVLSVNWSLYL